MKNDSNPNLETANSFNFFQQNYFLLKTTIRKIFILLLTCLFFQGLFAQPVVTSFVPLSGLPGSTVTIYGSGFSPNPSENIVFVGGAHAYVKTASANKLTVQVPRSTTNKPISVTVNNLTGFSAVPYLTTYKTGNVITPGTFETPKNILMDIRPYTDTAANIFDGFTIEDFDNDGKPDIYIKGRFATFDEFYNIFRNTSTPGNISFAPGIYLDVPFDYSPNVLPPADIDGDGKKDFLSREYDHMDILKNNSTPGNISFENAVSAQYDSSDNVDYIGTADLNGDGKPDLYGIAISAYRYYYTIPDSIAFTQNTSSGGNVSFAPPVLLHFSFLNHPYALVDFNGDGMIDVLSVTDDAASNFAVSVNTSRNGSVSFNAPQIVFPAGNNFLFGVGDINKDGKPDIAIGSFPYTRDSIYFLVNTSTPGNLSFAAPVSFPLGLRPENVRLVDIDGDGQPDICANDASSGNYVILKNTTTSKRLSFAPPVSFPAIKSRAIEFCDFDGDGRQDLTYSVKDYRPFISIYRNQTDTATGSPSIASFSPAKATQFDTLIIDGDNFNGTTNITLGGTAVQSFRIISNNRISAVVNMGSTGDLQVTTRKGVATKSLFTYVSDTTVKLLSSADEIVCSGQIVSVKAVVINADQGIVYSWYKNGQIQIPKGNIYTSHSLIDGDSLWCMVSFLHDPQHKEWKSDVIKFDVNLSQKLKLRIQSSKGQLICKGTPVTFNAIVGYEGFAPVFQWKKNNQVVGDSSDTYVDDKLKNGDLISCMIVRAKKCAILPLTAFLTMQVDSSRPATPALIIGPDEVSPSQAGIIFNVSQVSGARSYKWQIPSGASLASANSKDSIIVNWSSTTAKISVGASNACGVSSVITKTVHVTSSNNTRIATSDINKQITNEAAFIIVYPNPANSKASVIYQNNANSYNILELRDANGKPLLHQKIQSQKGQIRADINTSTFAPGVYYILLIDKNNKAISTRLVIAK